VSAVWIPEQRLKGNCEIEEFVIGSFPVRREIKPVDGISDNACSFACL
jgi:hypothetical protein